VVSLLGLIVNMLVEIGVLTLSLWLLFLTTDRSRGDSSHSGGGLRGNARDVTAEPIGTVIGIVGAKAPAKAQ